MITLINTADGTTVGYGAESRVDEIMFEERMRTNFEAPVMPYWEALEIFLNECREEEECETIEILEFMKADEIAAALRCGDAWNFDLMAALCREADMDDEWASAGEDFEAVVEAAADKLGVEIY